MTVVQEYENGKFRPWRGQMLTNADGTEFSAPDVIREMWSDEELRAVGLFRAEPFAVPAGKMVSGEAKYERKKGKVVESYTVVDEPPERPRATQQQTELQVELAALSTDIVKAKTIDDVKACLEKVVTALTLVGRQF